jgi:signal transduction histidine kinase
LFTVGASITSIVILAISWLWLFRAESEREAKAEARISGEVAGRVALAPFVTDELLAGDSAAAAAMAQATAKLMQVGDAIRVKVWTRDGTIVWSDDATAIGRTFELDEGDLQALDDQSVTVEVSSLDRDENEGERNDGLTTLLQVYVGLRTEAGTPVLVETYYPYSLVDDRVTALRNRYWPLLIGGLAALFVAQLPLARFLTKRIRRLQTEREQLLQRVITASDTERRRIAAEVHDGAVQDLIGVAFTLQAMADTTAPPLGSTIGNLASSTRRTVRSLRSLLGSIYPVEVPPEGWVSGLDEVIGVLRQQGVDVFVDVGRLDLSPTTQVLLLRVAREALRNVDAHAHASRVDFSVKIHNGAVRLEVTDNGVGFDDASSSADHFGHLGLQLLRDLARDLGAELVVTAAVGEGTTVRLDVEDA